MTAYCTLTEGRHYEVDHATGCWNWTLSITKDGYGCSAEGIPAHRRSFVEAGNTLRRASRSTTCAATGAA